jgi:hypothetical protein
MAAEVNTPSLKALSNATREPWVMPKSSPRTLSLILPVGLCRRDGNDASGTQCGGAQDGRHASHVCSTSFPLD